MKKVYFSPLVDQYFFNWIRKPTWDTLHWCDQDRFYQFLKAHDRYSRNKEIIRLSRNIKLAAKEFHPKLDEEHINEIVEIYIERARIIRSYLQVKFPDHLVEMRNPIAVWGELHRIVKYDEATGEFHPLYTDKELEEILNKHFGENWRE